MYKQTFLKQTLLVSTLAVVVVPSLIVLFTANHIIYNVYSINPTNPTNEIIKGSISSISNDVNSATTWIVTGVYKIENVKNNSNI